MSKDVVIRAEHLSKHYRLGVINHGTLYRDLQSWWARWRGRPDPNMSLGGAWQNRNRVEGDLFRALEDVSFEVQRGEILGVIGGNGAGKSTLLKVISRITAPSAGRVLLSGRVASLLEIGTGFHPELTGRENIFLNGAILGMSQREVSRKFDEIVDFAEISEFIDTPVKRYSSGMYVRLAFSVAAHLDSEILLMDEVLAVGDLAFQTKCLAKMSEVGSSGRTILFISHNMASVEKLCSKALVLKEGRVGFCGSVAAGLEHYRSDLSSSDVGGLDDVARAGDGRMRIADVWFSDVEGKRLPRLNSGQRVELHIRVEPIAEACQSVVLAVGIVTLQGEGVLHLSTETVGLNVKRVDTPNVFTCTLPRLTLRGGYYALNLFLTSNGQVSDWLQGACRFQVEDADFYGTGSMPPQGYSHVLADYSWESKAS